MKVFLSWSGLRSRAVAAALRDWMGLVLQRIEPWMSQQDISAGERWALEVAKELEAANFGILCLTKENLSAPWLLFEAGALTKSVKDGAVVPYLLDVEFSDILRSPLGIFQGKKADKAGTFELVQAINARAYKPVEATKLQRIFDMAWPDLEKVLKAIPQGETAVAKPKPHEKPEASLECDVLNVEVFDGKRLSSNSDFHVTFSLYLVPRTDRRVVIPIHRCEGVVKLGDSSIPLYIDIMRSAAAEYNQDASQRPMIYPEPNSLIVNGPGAVQVYTAATERTNSGAANRGEVSLTIRLADGGSITIKERIIRRKEGDLFEWLHFT